MRGIHDDGEDRDHYSSGGGSGIGKVIANLISTFEIVDLPRIGLRRVGKEKDDKGWEEAIDGQPWRSR